MPARRPPPRSTPPVASVAMRAGAERGGSIRGGSAGRDPGWAATRAASKGAGWLANRPKSACHRFRGVERASAKGYTGPLLLERSSQAATVIVQLEAII